MDQIDSLKSLPNTDSIKEGRNSGAREPVKPTHTSLIEDIMRSNPQNNHDQLLRNLIMARETRGFLEALTMYNINQSELRKTFSTKKGLAVLTEMADDPWRFKGQLGIVLSEMRINELPNELRERLNPKLSEMELSIVHNEDQWHLCSMAEGRLSQSMRETSCLIIGKREDPRFLLKFQGRMSALCLQDTITRSNEVFLAGNWYAPVSKDTKTKLRNAFDEGKASIDLVAGNWALMRSASNSPDITVSELISKAKKYAVTLPFEHGKFITFMDFTGHESVYTRAFFRDYHSENYQPIKI